MYSGQLSRRLGLIVGANNYQDPSFPPLHFAENDARALAQWLVNTKGGNWAPGNVQHVQGSHATQELIQSLITQMCVNISEKNDFALLYFAGHAFIDEQSGEGYLALVNTRAQDTTTALHLPSLFQNIMLRSQAAHILVILDCYQNGRRWNTQRTSASDASPLFMPALLPALQNYPNRMFLCSCRGNEFLPEAGERSLSSFMHSFILGMCGPAGDPATGAITLQQMYRYLFSTLGEQQRPQLFGRDQPPLYLLGEAPPTPQSQPLSPLYAPTPTEADRPITANIQPGAEFQPATERAAYATATAQAPLRTTDALANQQHQQQYSIAMKQAQHHLQAQQYPEAYASTEQALQIIPNDAAALILKSQILGTGGRTQDALNTIDQLLQINPNNATGWSTRAVLLSNLGQQQAAFEAIERSLTLEPNNPEAYGIKNTILANMAMLQSKAENQPASLTQGQERAQANAVVFFVSLLLQIGGLAIGIAGGLLLALQSKITSIPGLLLLSLGLLLLCVNAIRGTHRYGFALFIPPLLVSLITGGLLAAAYKVALTRIVALLQSHPTLVVPLFFLVGWLITTTILPLPLAIGGLISGTIARVRKR